MVQRREIAEERVVIVSYDVPITLDVWGNEDQPGTCSICDASIKFEDECVDSYSQGIFCAECGETELETARDEAIEFAEQHVKVTRKPHLYDPACRDAPTPEEYEYGYREAYTENSVAAHNRHRCSNYDALIRGLDRYDPFDQIQYYAIRSVVEDRIEDALLSGDDDRDLSDDEQIEGAA